MIYFAWDELSYYKHLNQNNLKSCKIDSIPYGAFAFNVRERCVDAQARRLHAIKIYSLVVPSGVNFFISLALHQFCSIHSVKLGAHKNHSRYYQVAKP